MEIIQFILNIRVSKLYTLTLKTVKPRTMDSAHWNTFILPIKECQQDCVIGLIFEDTSNLLWKYIKQKPHRESSFHSERANLKEYSWLV